MQSKIVKYNIDGLHKFVKGISSKHIVKVGIMGNKASRKEAGLANVEVGATHEFGSFTKGIPIRSFLRMPLSEKINDILKELTNKNAVTAIEQGKIVTVLKYLGIACENVIQQAFDSGGFGKWKQLSYRTLMGKLKGNLVRRKQKSAEQMFEGARHTSILIDSGQLRRSVTSKVE